MVKEGLSREDLEKRITYYEKKYGPYIEKRGLHNFKNLFRRPTLLEWTVLMMLLMGIFMAFAYQADIGSCQEVIKNPCLYCYQSSYGIIEGYDSDVLFDLSNFQIKEGEYINEG